jgi:hypothetical protein
MQYWSLAQRPSPKGFLTTVDRSLNPSHQNWLAAPSYNLNIVCRIDARTVKRRGEISGRDDVYAEPTLLSRSTMGLEDDRPDVAYRLVSKHGTDCFCKRWNVTEEVLEGIHDGSGPKINGHLEEGT